MPEDRYGVRSLTIEGLESLDERALRSCLATRERGRFSLNLGAPADPSCGVPPFDGERLHAPLFSWPWTEWPTFERSTFERDLERVERWLRARGYYGGRVVSARVSPPGAFESDRVSEADQSCGDGDDGCPVDVAIRVEEGEPVRIASVALLGVDDLEPRLQRALANRVPFAPGDRFDEAVYDGGKEALLARLEAASHARARVQGEVVVDPEARTADVIYRLAPGPRCRFGPIRVVGQGDLPVAPILGAAYLREGDDYDVTALSDAERAIYGLGAFASVRVEPQLDSTEGEVIPITIFVEPGRELRYGLGVGLESGRIDFGDQSSTAVPQWDVHLLLRVEHRNLFGGLQSLAVEDRPRLLFRDVFPGIGEGPQLGNELRVRFVQPAFLEPRTSLVFRGEWDVGPPPFGGDFFRHDIDASLGPERKFLGGRLTVAAGIRANAFINLDNEQATIGADAPTLPTFPTVRVCDAEGERDPPQVKALESIVANDDDADQVAGAEDLLGAWRATTREGLFRPCDYTAVLLEQRIRLDLRDRPLRTRRGVYLDVGLQEAGLVGAFDYIRITPDARFYAPLPARMVLAVRFTLGATFVLGARVRDEVTRRLGPDRFRLRGGGASSVRGYLPGALGDSQLGGTRRWEATVELRVPVTEDFGLVAFADAGDVHGGYDLEDRAPQDGRFDNVRFTGNPRFRFDHPHVSVGLGLRYYTLVGPLRLDVGVQIPGLQRFSGEPTEAERRSTLPFTDAGGAVHLTIGESF